MKNLKNSFQSTCNFKKITLHVLLILCSLFVPNLSLFANAPIPLQEAVKNNSVLIQLIDEWGTQNATPYFDSHGVMTVDYVAPETVIPGQQSNLDVVLVTAKPILIDKQGITIRINFILPTGYFPRIIHSRTGLPTNSVLGTNAITIIKQTSNLNTQWDIVVKPDPTIAFIDSGLLCKTDYIIEVGSIGKMDKNTPLLNTSPSTPILYDYNPNYKQTSLYIPHYASDRFMQHLAIYNQNGQLLYASSIHTNALVIDFQELGFGMGVYILEVVLDNGDFWRGLVGVV